MSLADKILTEFNTGNAMADSIILGKDYEVKELPLDMIEPHPENRVLSEKVIGELVKSIRRDGLGQAILVRELPSGNYQLIAGEHRFEAFKLLQTEDIEKYSTIPAIVRLNCSDETARHLLWATNVHSAGLSAAERGLAYEALGYTVEKMREENPEEYRGVRTNAIIAELASSGGNQVSESSVYRARKAYKDSLEDLEHPEPKKKDAQILKNEVGEVAIEALSKAIDKVNEAVENNSINPAWLKPYVKRLRYLSNIK